MEELIRRAAYKIRTYVNFFRHTVAPKEKERIVNDFHKLYYDSNVIGKTWNSSTFLGVPIQKCPFDLFVYQEILNEIKPDLIIETGTLFGGTTLFLAIMCEALQKGEILSIDIKDFGNLPKHKRVKYLFGSSVSEQIINQAKEIAKGKEKVLVILDSDHKKEHVLKELLLYSPLVSKDSYVIVEDSNVNGHPVYLEHGPGPMEAIQEFLKENQNFVVDRSREKHYLTFSPNGYLKRVK